MKRIVVSLTSITAVFLLGCKPATPHDQGYSLGLSAGRDFAKNGDGSNPDNAVYAYMIAHDGFGINDPAGLHDGYREGFKYGYDETMGFSHLPTSASPLSESTPTPTIDKHVRTNELVEHAFRAIKNNNFSEAAQDFEECSTLVSPDKPEVRRQVLSVSRALRQVDLTHSEADMQKVLTTIETCIIAMNTQRSIAKSPVYAQEAQREAIALYPELGIANSPLNKTFVARYHQYQIQNPKYFAEPDWPIKLAKECAISLRHH